MLEVAHGKWSILLSKSTKKLIDVNGTLLYSGLEKYEAEMKEAFKLLA